MNTINLRDIFLMLLILAVCACGIGAFAEVLVEYELENQATATVGAQLTQYAGEWHVEMTALAADGVYFGTPQP